MRLLETGGVLRDEGLIRTAFDALDGVLDVDLGFASGHTVSVFVGLTVASGYPLWTKYAFHLRDTDQRTVLRLDTMPYHPNVETFPDHAHVGADERVVFHPRPSLGHLVRDIGAAVGSMP